MISCEEAVIICNKAQYNDATFLEKLKLKLHTLFCSVCTLFINKNTKLTTLCEKANLKRLTEKDKSEMKEKLQKQI